MVPVVMEPVPVEKVNEEEDIPVVMELVVQMSEEIPVVMERYCSGW